MANILLVSLGCAKNQVNSEEMLHVLTCAGHTMVEQADVAALAVVNTCGFIDAAKEEAIEHILSLGQHKAKGTLKRILVVGCLAQRYRDELLAMPEVDGVLGTGSYWEIADAVACALRGEVVSRFDNIDAPLTARERIFDAGAGWAYLKIAEGCDNDCAYCVIPSIRGKFRSRSMDSLLPEARKLTDAGVRELILVAQDTTRYGLDLYGKRSLPELICKLAEIPTLHWIRLHYLYPDGIDDALIETIRDTQKAVRYLDIPIQHISDEILTAMRRRGSGAQIRALIQKLRKALPGLVLRTSLIAGLPGEGEREFCELAAFLQEMKLERVGAFPYSPQENTAAAAMPNRPSEDDAEQRVLRLMTIQQETMDSFNQSRLGTTDTVLCTGFDEERGQYFGRSYAESPEVDGVIWLESAENLAVGTFYNVCYTGQIDGELAGEIMPY